MILLARSRVEDPEGEMSTFDLAFFQLREVATHDRKGTSPINFTHHAYLNERTLIIFPSVKGCPKSNNAISYQTERKCTQN